VLPWVDVATGSLGQGRSDGFGVALAGRYLDELPYRVWVLCGDSEMAEGSMWEAFDKAAYYRLANLTAIVDVNRLGQRGPTELGWDLDAYARRVEAFGCRAIPIDGHDLGEIDKALTQAAGADRPAVILARTRKGRGFSEVEDREGWHGRPLPAEMAERAIVELGGARHLTVRGPLPEGGSLRARPDHQTAKAISIGAHSLCILEASAVSRAQPGPTAADASRPLPWSLCLKGWERISHA
jgi:transketolase